MTDITAALKAEIDAIKAARDDMPFGLSRETEEMLAVMEAALNQLDKRDAQIAELEQCLVRAKELHSEYWHNMRAAQIRATATEAQNSTRCATAGC